MPSPYSGPLPDGPISISLQTQPGSGPVLTAEAAYKNGASFDPLDAAPTFLIKAFGQNIPAGLITPGPAAKLTMTDGGSQDTPSLIPAYPSWVTITFQEQPA